MTEQEMKELLFSLAWLPHSSHHSRNVKEILNKAFPDCDFELDLEEYKKIVLSEPGEGSPK